MSLKPRTSLLGSCLSSVSHAVDSAGLEDPHATFTTQLSCHNTGQSTYGHLVGDGCLLRGTFQRTAGPHGFCMLSQVPIKEIGRNSQRLE